MTFYQYHLSLHYTLLRCHQHKCCNVVVQSNYQVSKDWPTQGVKNCAVSYWRWNHMSLLPLPKSHSFVPYVMVCHVYTYDRNSGQANLDSIFFFEGTKDFGPQDFDLFVYSFYLQYQLGLKIVSLLTHHIIFYLKITSPVDILHFPNQFQWNPFMTQQLIRQ